jgi:two-component system sensor histidine kinase FlrB
MMSVTEIAVEKSPRSFNENAFNANGFGDEGFNEQAQSTVAGSPNAVVRPFISLSGRVAGRALDAGTVRNTPHDFKIAKGNIHQSNALKSDIFKKESLPDKEKLADRLQTLLYLLPAGVVVIDGSGRVQQCNAAAIDLLGEPLEGQKWFDIIKRCFSPRRDDGHEVSLKDGRRVSIAIRSLDNEPGQLILLTDLTETRALQSKLSRHERLSSMGKMVASLAHQVRTPLSAAMLYAGHLCEERIDDELRQKCAGKLMSRLVHLEQQVRDMLTFVKGDTPPAEKVTVAQLMQDLKVASDAAVVSSAVDVTWHSDVQAEVLCNREALIGALMNLVNNSIEARKDGLKLCIGAQQVKSDTVRLLVRDNGPGFSDRDKRKVTEAFYTTKAQGTGLGLAVVQAVVKAHRGRFDITSDAGGTTAMIELPVFKANA